MTWFILAIGSALFAALVAIFGKLGLSSIDSTLATTLRSIVMAVFLVLTSLAFGKFEHVSGVSHKTWLYIVLAGVAGALSWLCYFLALKLGPVNGVAGIDRTSIVFVVILSAVFLGEAISWKTGLGAGFMLAGALLLTIK